MLELAYKTGQKEMCISFSLLNLMLFTLSIVDSSSTLIRDKLAKSEANRQRQKEERKRSVCVYVCACMCVY